jgi:hypothetical protein
VGNILLQDGGGGLLLLDGSGVVLDTILNMMGYWVVLDTICTGWGCVVWILRFADHADVVTK